MSGCWDYGWEGPILSSQTWGSAIDPVCGNPDARSKLPPEITPHDYLVVLWTPHDPNAMLGPEGYVTPGQLMTYTVMFENEGLGTAFDVYVTDIFDGNLDDSNIVIKDFYLVDWATNTETPVTLPYSYDPQSHKLTVLAGTFESRQGGKFTVELRLKPDVPQGTVVKNFATVYFPTALEETRTNSIISAVPQPALVTYTGSTVAVYSSYAMIAATVTNSGQTLLGKTVNFYVGGSTLTALTGGTGEASVYAQVDAPPGDYELTAAFPGDGYYYTSSTQVVTLQIRKSETYIADFSTVTYSTNPVITVAMTNSKGVQILHQDTAIQTIHLEYQTDGRWEPLGHAALSSGTAIFQFPLPQPTTTTYHLKAKYNGNDHYFPTESTATLAFADITPPTVELAVNGSPLEAGATAQISDTDTITITAKDFGTGPKNILYTLDVAFSTSAAIAYGGPFSLPAGTHTVYYSAEDNVGNISPIKTALLTVAAGPDVTPPVTHLWAAGQEIADGTTSYILTSDTIAVVAEDDGSGVAGRFYTLNVAFSTEAAREYTTPFALPAGTHTIYYSAFDNSGNQSPIKAAYLDVSLNIAFNGIAQSTTSILWTWNSVADAVSYQVFSSTGGAVSEMLSSGEVSFLQTGLAPNVLYGNFLRIYVQTGGFDSSISSAATAVSPPGVIEAFSIGQNASLVIGQSDFISRGYGVGANRLAGPSGVTLDAAGNLWVSDMGNNRVLRFSPPFSNGMNADLVVGQPDFNTSSLRYQSPNTLSAPMALTFDAHNNAWVSDTGYCRILKFAPPFSNGMNASLAIGANTLNYPIPSNCGTAANKLRSVAGIKFDKAGNLWSADLGINSRVLRFSPPFSNGMDADLVIGRPDFISAGYNYFPTDANLSNPKDMDFDSEGNLWVADIMNDRALKFTPPFTNGMSASLVIGQSDFVSNNNITGLYQPSQNRLYGPGALDFDAHDNLYILDSVNNRILKYEPPFANGMDAALVLGQYDFTSRFNINMQASFSQPYDATLSGLVFSDQQNRLWVADTGNGRVLMFEPIRSGIFTEVGVSSFTVNWLAGANPQTTRYVVEISPDENFFTGVINSGFVDGASFKFTGLQGGTKYFARVKAVNLSGVPTNHVNLNFTVTRPAPILDLKGTAQSAGSILWTWISNGTGLNFQIFSSTGGALSTILSEGTTQFLQTGLNPNTLYSAFIRSSNVMGSADSGLSEEATYSNIPAKPEPFVSGQNASIVIGQADFTGRVQGAGQNNFNWVSGAAFDNSGHLWAVDSGNCRILRFDYPFSNGMSASLVIGQPDFDSTGCGVNSDTLLSPTKIAFDASDNLWVSDQANRVLRFSKPFINGQAADLVIGQPDFVSSGYGTASNRLFWVTGMSFDAGGNLWVADNPNYRVLKFAPPFSTGMDAALVLGQNDFNSRNLFPTSANTFQPRDVAFDGSGNLWLADSENSRVLRFSPSFYNNMNADLVIGQPNFTSKYYTPTTPATLWAPESLGFDQAGALYVSDGGNNRVLKYKPPFSNTMDAALVFGKQDFYSNNGDVAQNKIGTPADNYLQIIDGKSTLWIADAGNVRVLGFWEINGVFTGITAASFTANWISNGNNPDTEYKVEISTDIGFAQVLSASAWLKNTSFGFNNLYSGTDYHVRIKSRNIKNVESGYFDMGHVKTLSLPQIVVTSTITIDGKPEITLSSYKQMSVTLVSTASSAGIVALGTAAAQGLFSVSNLYDLLPEGTYTPPAMLTFYYSTAALGGIPENELAVYEYFSGEGWRKLEGPPPDTINHKITVPVYNIASLFSIFWRIEDAEAPQTLLSVSGGSWVDESGKNYISEKSSITFEAYDPVVYGTATGVAFTEYRVDPDTSMPFVSYTSPFTLPTGTRTVEFRSRDKAGNFEIVKSTTIFVDGEPPAVRFEVSGASFAAAGILYAASGSTVTLSSMDEASGVKGVYYSVSGGTYAALSGQATLLLSLGGPHTINYSAEDHVANVSLEETLVVYVDTSAPVSAVNMSGVAGRNGWYISGIGAAISASDDRAGVRETLYRLNGSSFGVYASSFAVAEEGRHTLETYSIDNVSNIETAKTIMFDIDTSAPAIGYSRAPAANADGWSNTPVEVIFTGTDAVSGIEYCSSSVTILGEGKDIPASGYCMDYAGWSSTAALTVSIDTTAPDMAYAAEPAANSAGWNNSDVAVKFTCADGLSGVKSCPADMLLAGEGLNVSTSAAAYDYAGNIKNVFAAGVNIDKTAPVSTAVVSGVYRNGWYSSPAAVALASTDALSGIRGVFYVLDSGGYAAYTQPVVVSSEGKHGISFYGEDMAGNREAVKTSEFGIDITVPTADYLLDPIPNADGWNTSTVNVMFRGSDTLSGVEECSSVSVAVEGKGQELSGWCRDLAGNTGYSTATLNIDLTSPVVSAAQFPVPNIYGWNNGAVEVSFAGTDAVSGIAYCEPAKGISVEGASQTISGYCMDYAGWSSTQAVVANIDMTPPAVSYTLVPAANEAGWLNTDVLARFTCSDTLSGVQFCPDAVLLADEGVDISTAAKAYDYAGNSKEISVSGINMDKTAPVSTAVIAGSVSGGWYSSSVSVILTSTDALSGVKEILYSLDGADFAPYQQAIIVFSEGTHSLKYYAWDEAGNREVENSIEFKIDTSAPLVTYVLDPAPNADGWNNTPVAVVFSDTDTLSGVAECSSQTVSSEGRAQLITGWCRDVAGNIGYSTATLNIDTTPAAILITSPASGAKYMAADIIGIDFSISDNLSLVSSSSAWLHQTADNGAPRGALPDIIPVTAGQSLAAAGIDDGIWQLIASATDYAGNYFYAAGGAFEVIHDTIPPVTAIVFSSVTAVEPDGRVLLPENVLVSFQASDASGYSTTRYFVDSGTAAEFMVAFALSTGAHFITYWSTDNAGNIEAAKTAQVFVGNPVAVVALDLDPDTLNLNSNGQYVTAMLTAGGSNTVCFSRTGVNISAINGTALVNPIYEAASHGNSDEDHGRSAPAKDKGDGKDNGKGKDDSNDGHNDNDDPGHDGEEPSGDDGDFDHNGGSSVQCGTMTVKFDRGELIAVLPVNAMVKVTVSGKFADGRDFSVDDTIRTIKPRLTSRRDGGRFEHNKRACVDAPPMALKADDELYVVSVESDMSGREAKKEGAAKARGVVRRGLAYEFGPDGAVFDKPVTISLPYDADEKSPEQLVVAYWNETAGSWEPLASRYDAQTRVVKAEVGHFSQYQLVQAAPTPSGSNPVVDVPVVLGADPTFKLGEVYVFPNPAKGGAKPVFHIETGIADTVEITIYTVSGRTAHKHAMGGAPAAIDDGNGVSYAYEYTWDGHIPSGVYYYSVTAEKAGRKLKKAGKFAVIR